MDFKRNVILYLLLSVACIFFSCDRKSANKSLINNISIDGNVVRIEIDNTNKLKPIGDIHRINVCYISENKIDIRDNVILIESDISISKKKYYDGVEYCFTVSWYGGALEVNTIYIDNHFEIISEVYQNGI